MGGVLLDDTRVESMRQEVLLEVSKKYLPHLKKTDILHAWLEASKIPGSVRINALKVLLNDQPETQEAEEEYKNLCNFDYHKLSHITPDAQEVLVKLSRSYRLGLMANQSAKSLELIQEAGLANILNHTQMSEHIGLEKPNPKFYSSILNGCHAKAEESVLVDDNWYRGLAQAKNIGMKTILLKRNIIPTPPEAKPDWTIYKLPDLLKIF